MVLWYKASHQYQGHDFSTVSTLYLNRYPNPYASHVISVDVISTEITKDGKLLQTKLISKKGRTPKFLSIFLGNINQTWIVEKTQVDPKTHEMMTYTRNLDHTKIIRIEEYTKFQYNQFDQMSSKSVVKFSSGFQVTSIKDRIESWSHLKFGENLARSRKGLAFVMENFKLPNSTASSS